MDDVTILSARRSYEFRADGIRLTLLSSRTVIEHLRQAFSFEVAAASTPVATFGPVPGTVPPGLVFAFGLTPVSDIDAVPVRFLNVEPRRIVIDVAGPSSTIEPTFRRFWDLVADLKTLDGKPALDTPIATLDYSEITARMPFPPIALLHPALRAPMDRVLDSVHASPQMLVPSLLVQSLFPDQEFSGSVARDHRSLTLETRLGTHPDDRIFFSGGPLDTDAHLSLLASVEAAITLQDGRSELS